VARERLVAAMRSSSLTVVERMRSWTLVRADRMCALRLISYFRRSVACGLVTRWGAHRPQRRTDPRCVACHPGRGAPTALAAGASSSPCGPSRAGPGAHGLSA
jgi:hypothetical protein